MENEDIVIETTTPEYTDLIKEAAIKAVTTVVITAVASILVKTVSVRVAVWNEARKAKKTLEQ